MRRILRKVIAGEADQLGDLSSIADPSVVDDSKLHLIFGNLLLMLCPVIAKVGGKK